MHICDSPLASFTQGGRVRVDLSLLGDMGNPTMAQVQAVVGHQFGLTREDLRSPYRDARLSWARHVAMFVARNETRASLPAIGAAFGNRGHTTVLHGIRRVTEKAASDEEARREVVDALTALWLGVVERRLHRPARPAWNAAVGPEHLERGPTFSSAAIRDPDVQVTELARTIIRERYSTQLEKGQADVADPYPSATWTSALTIWLVLLESSASMARIAPGVGDDAGSVVQAVRCINLHGFEDPQMRDELFALVEALRLRRDPSSGRVAGALATTAPVLTLNYDAYVANALLCPVCESTRSARSVAATVCKYFDTSPSALQWDDGEEMRWARDLTFFLIYAERRAADQQQLAPAGKKLDEIERRVRNRVVHDEPSRRQFLTILAELRSENHAVQTQTGFEEDCLSVNRRRSTRTN